MLQHGYLSFSTARSVTITDRDGAILARTAWRSRHLSSDSGISVSPDGHTFAFRLSDVFPGSARATAIVGLLRTGSTAGQTIYRHRLGSSGCAVGANLSWQGRFLLYSSADGQRTVIDTANGTTIDLETLARALPHRSRAELASASWRGDYR